MSRGPLVSEFKGLDVVEILPSGLHGTVLEVLDDHALVEVLVDAKGRGLIHPWPLGQLRPVDER